MFSIFFDPDYKEPDYNAIYNSLKLPASIPIQVIPNLTCFYDTNSYWYEHFFIGTENKDKVCAQCVKDKDPQAQNILDFIIKGKSLEAKLAKLAIGMDQLRKQIAFSDPLAKKCPICNMKKAYRDSIQGRRGYSCLNCNVGYRGAGQFVFNNKLYTLEQACKIYSMKAFT